MTNLHPNSLAAFRSETLRFNQREQHILDAFKNLGICTDRAIAAALGFNEMNAVRPRITELINSGILEESGTTICPVTKKRVRLCRIVPRTVQTELKLA